MRVIMNRLGGVLPPGTNLEDFECDDELYGYLQELSQRILSVMMNCAATSRN